MRMPSPQNTSHSTHHQQRDGCHTKRTDRRTNRTTAIYIRGEFPRRNLNSGSILFPAAHLLRIGCLKIRHSLGLDRDMSASERDDEGSDRRALLGSWIIRNESPRVTAKRQMREIDLHATGNYRLVGVYQVNFKRRSDITICLSTRLHSEQEPRPTRELVRYSWRRLGNLPSRVGSNYRAMLRDFSTGHYRVR